MASLEQVQARLLQSFDKMNAASFELGSMSTEIDFLNTDRLAKDQQIEEL